MKKFIFSLALVCGLSTILPAQVESLSRNQNRTQNQTQAAGKELQQEQKSVPDKSLLKVFDSLYHMKSGENVMLSAWGIQECFGMICGGAGAESAAELSRILGINNQTAVWLDGARTSLL